MENKRLGCIHRDRNACLNMKKLFKYYMSTGLRPDQYTRGHDLSTSTGPKVNPC